MVEDVGHEGGVVGQSLAHAQRDGLAGEQAVAARRRVHGDGHARRQHGHGQHPQDVHVRLRRQREEEMSGLERGRSASGRGTSSGPVGPLQLSSARDERHRGQPHPSQRDRDSHVLHQHGDAAET